MSAHKARVLDWFERQACTYWKLYPAQNREMLARFWPAKDNEEASSSETPDAGAAALDTELETLEPGKYTIKACLSSKPKDTASYFSLTFTVPKTGTESETARVQGQQNPLGFAQTGIFGHPDVQAHLKQMEVISDMKLQLAILQIQMKNGGAAEAPPSPMEKAIAAFVGNLAPHAASVVAAFMGAAVPPVAATPQTQAQPPVAGANDEATIVEDALIRIKAADPDYFTKLQALANYAEKNPEGFKSILGSVSLLQ